MRKDVILILAGAALLVAAFMLSAVDAGGRAGGYYGPPLDDVLMGFKEQGVWYFPCCAPAYLQRIPPHYAVFGPPPFPYCPPPVSCSPYPAPIPPPVPNRPLK